MMCSLVLDAEVVTISCFCISRDMFCAGRVPEEDLKRTMQACGGSIQTSVSNMVPSVLGTCEHFEEQQIGGDRWVRLPLPPI